MPADRTTQPQTLRQGGVVVKKHWLHGTIRMRIMVEKETNCGECIHVKVCNRDMEKRCANYELGTSQYTGCAGCIHRHTRYDKDENRIPCFCCEDFLAKLRES